MDRTRSQNNHKIFNDSILNGKYSNAAEQELAAVKCESIANIRQISHQDTRATNGPNKNVYSQ